VDYIVLFDEPDPYQLIQALLPDILIKGADWEKTDIIGADVVEENGGEIRQIPFEYPVSTSKIIERIVRLYRDEYK
jgi:bifunctional ADP-heptose synthase (sugar kinase/adenylyltransferase)